MTQFITGMCIGILIGMAFIAYIAGHDWQNKVDNREFTWRNVNYTISEKKGGSNE